MKNIYVLPTEKLSKLFCIGGKLQYSVISKVRDNNEGVHIYITSSEEIKEDDWFILDMSHSSHSDELHQMGNDKWSKTGGIHFYEGNSWVKSCKKIILTTDPELIKDDVQAISDEFLEWFVKNPSCEKVEVDINEIACLIPNFGDIDKYEIIFPKEDLGYMTKSGIKVTDEMVRATMIPKEYFGEKESKQERMYTEKDMIHFLEWCTKQEVRWSYKFKKYQKHWVNETLFYTIEEVFELYKQRK